MSGAGGGGGVLREILARFGFEVDSKKLAETNTAIEGLIGKVKHFAGAIASGAFVVGLRHWVNETAAAGKEIRNSAVALGVSTADLQEWRAVAELAGVEAGALSMGFGLLQRKALDASRGGAAAAMFRRIGVEVKTASGELKDPATLFEEVGFAIAGMTNATERTGTALEFFGRAGRQFVPIFAQGREKVAEMRAELGELGAELSDEQLAKLKEYSGATHAIGLMWEGFKNAVVFAVLPAFTWVAEALEKAGRVFVKLTQGTHVFQIALGLMGAAALVTAVKTAAAFAIPLLVIAAVAVAAWAVVAAIDDVIVTFEGGDSIIRRFVDGLFGIGATASAVEWVKQAVDDLAWGFSQAWATITAGGWDLFNTIVLWAAYIVAGPIAGLIQGVYSIGAAFYELAVYAASGFGGIAGAITTAILEPIRMAYNGLRDFAALISEITGFHGAGAGRWDAHATGGGAPTVRASASRGGVQQRNQTNITINAGAAGAEEIGAEVERRIDDAHTRHVDAALASMPNGVEGSGW